MGTEAQATQPSAAPIELLDLEALRKLPSDVMEVDEQCLYFLWAGDDLLYIGATTQASYRIGRHIRDRNYASAQSGAPIPFDRCTFLATPDRRQMWELENAYQRHYDPPCNTVSHQRRRY